MDTLSGIECFVCTAEAGSFAQAARRLGLTATAVGKNVAKLEASLRVRLFHRSTRNLTLTEAGERFLRDAALGMTTLRTAMSNLEGVEGRPVGTLKVSMGPAFGRDYIVPLLEDFMARYPEIEHDWHFDNRVVDLIAEGFDAAIAGSVNLPPGAVARELAPAHRVLLASPAYLAANPAPGNPDELWRHTGILIRSPQTGRVRPWSLRHRDGRQAAINLPVRMTMGDPDAACRVAQMGFGITLVSTPHAEPYLRDGTLIRVLPDWYVDAGAISIYFSAQKMLPRKTRVFVDYLIEQSRAQGFSQRFSAC